MNQKAVSKEEVKSYAVVCLKSVGWDIRVEYSEDGEEIRIFIPSKTLTTFEEKLIDDLFPHLAEQVYGLLQKEALLSRIK